MNLFNSKTNNESKYSSDSHHMNFNKMRTTNSHTQLTNNCVQPFFENLEEHLVEYIEKSSYIIGCVAWLTNPNIIEALENSKGVKIIINKEEYLNSSMEIGKKFFYKCLRGKYNEIPDMFVDKCICCTKQIDQCVNFTNIFGNKILAENISIKSGAILTCGIVNNFSKMHHKFLIFFDENINPLGVWTGSYNLSKTSNFSLENALYITDKSVIMEYVKEFLAIYPFSESYDWKSGVLCAPILG